MHKELILRIDKSIDKEDLSGGLDLREEYTRWPQKGDYRRANS